MAGEIHWRVPSMRSDEAAQLFIEHARATRRDLAIRASDLHVAHICKRLDGIPLAIEMAAAQVAFRSVVEVAAALDAHLALAMPGHRAVTPRHRTLRATLDWSYGLLASQDQIFLARASVFSGNWTDEAAQAICAEDSVDVSVCVSRLVRASLVITIASGDYSRYRLTETVRQYAHEKLLARNELAATRDRHLDHYLAGAEADHYQSGRQYSDWQSQQESTIDNLRVPADQMLGMSGEGFKYAQVRLSPARLSHCMRWLGACRRAHEIATDYACRREAFGRLLVDHEGVGFMLAENLIDLKQSELMIDWCAGVLDTGSLGTAESSMAKVSVSEALMRVADRCVQVMGGTGVSTETIVEQAFREIRAFRIYDGPTEVHKWSLARKIKRDWKAARG